MIHMCNKQFRTRVVYIIGHTWRGTRQQLGVFHDHLREPRELDQIQRPVEAFRLREQGAGEIDQNHSDVAVGRLPVIPRVRSRP